MISKEQDIIIKTPEQIQGIRQACVLAADALVYVGQILRAGMTTEELDNAVHDFIADHGAVPAPLNYMGFPKSTCISVNEVVCHGIPDGTVMRDGDIVKVDISTILKGYFGDNCATFGIGTLSQEARDLIDTAQVCLARGIDQVKPGKNFGDIGYAIATYAHAKNCSVVYQYAGHGTGLKFHEPPTVLHIADYGTGRTFVPGYIFTIEPMINAGVDETELDTTNGWTVRTVDRKLSAQFEETVLVTESGVEILTVPSKNLQ